jgi:hypothetical protein
MGRQFRWRAGWGRACHCLSLSLRLWIRVTVAIRDHVSRVRAWMPPPLLQTSNANERLQLICGVWRWEWYTTEASDDTPLHSSLWLFICYDFGPHKNFILQETRSTGTLSTVFFEGNFLMQPKWRSLWEDVENVASIHRNFIAKFDNINRISIVKV